MLPITNAKIAKALELVDQLARMTTPYDPAEVEKFKRTWPQGEDLEGEELNDMIHAEYPSDDAIEDASTLWRLIKQAREIIGATS